MNGIIEKHHAGRRLRWAAILRVAENQRIASHSIASWSRLIIPALVVGFACACAAQTAPTEIERGPRGAKKIALTFDAGGEADCFYDLVAALARAHVSSTFFITGKWAYENPECAKAITVHGHEVGNHTWRHLDLTQQSDAVIREELQGTEVFLSDLCGKNRRPLWRAPYGARNTRVLNIAHALGYQSIYWTLDSLDSIDPPKSAGFLYERITSRSNEQLDGAIILMHVGPRGTADALPTIIGNLQKRGFQLVTVSTLLRAEPH